MKAIGVSRGRGAPGNVPRLGKPPSHLESSKLVRCICQRHDDLSIVIDMTDENVGLTCGTRVSKDARKN